MTSGKKIKNMVKNMKKILVGIFVVLFSLPAMAGLFHTCVLVNFKVQYDIAETERLDDNEIEFVPIYCPGRSDGLCEELSLTSGETTLSVVHLTTDADKGPIGLNSKEEGFERYLLPDYSYDYDGLDFSKLTISGEPENTFYNGAPITHQLLARSVESVVRQPEKVVMMIPVILPTKWKAITRCILGRRPLSI